MRPAVARRLLALNRDFYSALAEPFARTRARPQPGFEPLLDYLPRPCSRLLDVGCGEGRFGRFLLQRHPHVDYVGLDFSAELLAQARTAIPGGTFYRRDISRPGYLDGLGDFSVIAALAVLQHIPGRASRVALLNEAGRRLLPGGRILLSTWQFLDSERQRRKIVDWTEVDLDPRDVDDNDYLLTWKAGGFGLRYVAYIDAGEIAQMAEKSGLTQVGQFRSDGREGDLNLYTILERRSTG